MEAKTKMKNIMTLIVLFLSGLMYAQTVQVRDIAGCYRTIQAGINACPNGGTVSIYPGTYTGTENTNLSWSNKNITLKGETTLNNVIIDCQNLYNYGINISSANRQNQIKYLLIKNSKCAGINISNGNPKIINCILEYNPQGICINNSNNFLQTYLESCTFRYNANSILGGSGLYALGRISVKNCTFSFNSANAEADDPSILHGTHGAAIYCTADRILLENNTFTNNYGTYDGGTVTLEAIQSDSTFCYVLNNKFDSNVFEHVDLAGVASVSLSVKNSNQFHDIIFKNNIFANNYADHLPSVNITGTSISSNSFKFWNNTFSNELLSEYALYLKNQMVSVENCIFCTKIASNTSGSIKYCRLIDQFVTFPTTFYSESITYGDPLLDDNFKPLWNQSFKSELIDNGNPDIDNDQSNWIYDPHDQDYDGTRMDIGAVQAEDHGSLIHNFVNNGTTNQFNWICFPYLDKVYTDTSQYDVDQMGYVVDEYHSNGLLSFLPTRILELISWNYNSDNGIVSYQGSSWSNSAKTIDSRYGFKVQLKSNCSSKSIEDTGFLCGHYGNTNQIITINAPESTNSYREIWVGYFKKQSEEPLFALSDVVSKLIQIKTKNWSMSRPNTRSAWWSSSSNPLLNIGEMVILRYVGENSSDFIWRCHDNGNELMAYSEPTTQYFTYNEQADYTPVYVVLEGNTAKSQIKNAELGLFVNGICYGAEVVQGDTVQINAYIDELPDSNAVVEFRYWNSEMKSEPMSYNQYSVYNFEAKSYQNRPVCFNEKRDFYSISLSRNDIANGAIPKTSNLEGNYPNPFNPETTIKYSISEKSNVSLTIYNVKGQIVKELVNEIQNPGFKSVVWNGKDSKQKSVSSGVYFYRLETNNHHSIRKMLLMK